MTQPVSFHNTTNLTGEELTAKDMVAQSQEKRLLWIMNHLNEQVEWWTRDALNRAHVQYFERRLKDQSISRALSNLSAWFCTGCRKYHSGAIFAGEYGRVCPKCGQPVVQQNPKLEKSETAMWRSDEGDRVHAWRLPQDKGQGELFNE